MRQRAVAAAVDTARHHGLRVDEPVVLHDLFSVRVHLRPAPVVARVPTWIGRLRPSLGETLARELDVAAFLAAGGAPVVAPSAELPAGPHDAGELSVSYWTYVVADPQRVATAADCAAMLVDLHAALDHYPGTLPQLVPTLIDHRRWLDVIDGHGQTNPTDHRRLLRAVERLEPWLTEAQQSTHVLHGDAHPGNLIATRDGLLWTDFEEVCRGPVEWDLATIGDPSVSALHHRPDPRRLDRCDRLRALQVAMCLMALRDIFGDIPGWDDGIRDCLDALERGGDER